MAALATCISSSCSRAKVEIAQENKLPLQSAQQFSCGIENLVVPANAKIYAAGEYSGHPLAGQIDQSGHSSGRIDVIVNSPNEAVILLLGAYEPTIWNIQVTAKTNLVGVALSGYHKQIVGSIPKDTPLRMYPDAADACGSFYVSQSSLADLNPISRKIFQRAVDRVFLANDGVVRIGTDLSKDTEAALLAKFRPDDYFDRHSAPAGIQGLKEAEKRGLIRAATAQDIEAFNSALKARRAKLDIPPIAGGHEVALSPSYLVNAYVIIKKLVMPSGLYGGNSAQLFLPPGVPKPSGELGHSTIFDIANGTCITNVGESGCDF